MTYDSSPVPAPQDAGELRLPRPPGVIRRYWARHPRFTDVLVMLIYAVPQAISVLVGVVDGSDIGGGFLALGLGAVVSVVLVLWRRTHPIVTTAFALAACLILMARMNDSGVVALCLGLYAIAIYVGVREVWIAFGVSAGAFIVVSISTELVGRATTGDQVVASGSIVPVAVTAMFIATLIGINLGNRKRYIAALVDRAAQLVRERDQQAQLAAASERSRIAREMHDIVAHSLSVMVRLADGAEAMVEKDPDASLEAVRNIGATGRTSLTEMRRLLGVLRDEEDALAGMAPQPTLDTLPELVDSYRAAGLPVRVQTTGIAPTAEGVQVAVYRAVQETLTNALRYASQPTDVLVQLDYSGRGVDLTVADDGAGGPVAESQGSGRGLIGLAERAALYGGTVESGRQRGGGWRVHMTMPEAGDDET